SGLFGDVLGRNLEFFDQFPGSAGIAETVFYADCAGNHGDAIERWSGTDDAVDQAGKSADLVLFGGNHHSSVERGAQDGATIERLQRVHVNDASLVAELLFQDPRRPHRLGHHGAASDDGEIFVFVPVVVGQLGDEGFQELLTLAAQANDISLAECEWSVGGGDDRGGFAGKADVLRAH